MKTFSQAAKLLCPVNPWTKGHFASVLGRDLHGHLQVETDFHSRKYGTTTISIYADAEQQALDFYLHVEFDSDSMSINRIDTGGERLNGTATIAVRNLIDLAKDLKMQGLYVVGGDQNGLRFWSRRGFALFFPQDDAQRICNFAQAQLGTLDPGTITEKTRADVQAVLDGPLDAFTNCRLAAFNDKVDGVPLGIRLIPHDTLTLLMPLRDPQAAPYIKHTQERAAHYASLKASVPQPVPAAPALRT